MNERITPATPDEKIVHYAKQWRPLDQAAAMAKIDLKTLHWNQSLSGDERDKRASVLREIVRAEYRSRQALRKVLDDAKAGQP